MTTPFKHENVIKLAGVLGVAPELRLTSGGNAVATLIVYTNYVLRNEDGSTRQESERHRVIVWGMHAQKAARLLRKGSKIRVQGRMTYPTWKDKQTGMTRYGAEIVAQTLDYQGANDEAEAPIAELAVEAPAPQPAEAATAEAPAKPKRRRAIWEKVGGALDESFRFAVDWDLLLRFRDAGATFVRLPRFLGAFRVHGNQKTATELTGVGAEEILRASTTERKVLVIVEPGVEPAPGTCSWSDESVARTADRLKAAGVQKNSTPSLTQRASPSVTCRGEGGKKTSPI